MARLSVGEVRDLACEIVARELEAAHVRQQRGSDDGQLHAFRRASHQLRIGRLLEAAQADAERWLTESQGFRCASQVPVLGDHGEILDVAKVHVINRFNVSGKLR